MGSSSVLVQPYRFSPGIEPGSLDIRSAAVRDALTVIAPSSWYQSDPLYWTGSSGIQVLRFLNVGIPNGATIDSATLTVYTNANMGGATTNDKVRVHGEDVDSATQITSAADAVARFGSNKTSAFVDWHMWQANGPLTGADQPVISPGIAAVVQEIVNRPGWEAGNAMQFFVEDLGTSDNSLAMRSYSNGAAGTYPRLLAAWS